jgi:tetratricopeptide (TPR) repeat protein
MKNSGIKHHNPRPPPAKPPVAPARIAVLKANYKQAWLYFLFILSLLIAWAIPVRYLITRHLAFRALEGGTREASAFVVLAYEGISTDPDEVSPEVFRQQLSALRDAGYRPITLEDVHRFYREDRLLPERAVLMTFDHSRKSSYFDARTPLSRAGWPAVMFLWTLPIEIEDPAGLRWPYIRTMIQSGAWEAGAQSHRGFETIVADSDGSLRNFLTAPRWVPEDMRFETPEAFRSRLQEDHQFVRALVEEQTGTIPRAFAFPYGDFGQHDERAVLSRRLNMDLVRAFYDLAFIHGDMALNTRFSDPYRLNRLLVRPEWSAEDLLARLEEAWPKEQGIRNREAFASPLVWLPEWGHVEIGSEEIQLQGTEETTGATAWLSGSDLFGDFVARFRIRLKRGQLGLFFRASPDGERHVYLGIGEDGQIWLRQKHPGLPAVTLGSSRYTPDYKGEIDLEVDMRGSLFVATINGRMVFQEIINLRGDNDPGMLGVSVWDPQPDVADVAVTEMEAAPINDRIITWTPIARDDPSLAVWLRRAAVGYTYLSPPWLRVASRSRSEQFGWHPQQFRLLAETYGMHWLPEVIIDNIDIYDDTLSAHLAAWSEEMGADGIYCDLSEVKGAPSLTRLTTLILDLNEAMKTNNLELLVRLPLEWERETTISSLLQSMPRLRMAVAEADQEWLARLPRERIVRVEQAALASVWVPQVEELSGLDAELDINSNEVRGQLLRQQGFDAYRLGRFEVALESWQRWAELEPQNEEPHRLIGDLHMMRSEHRDAVGAYEESLDRNPGQIPLVSRVARLLDQHLERPREAAALLDLYARLFPANPDIKLAQAEFLLKRNHRADAGALVQEVVEENPDDLDAMAMLHSLLEQPADRMRNMKAMLAVGSRPGIEPYFVEVIRSNELLTWPESWVLMPFIEEQAARETAEGRPGAYGQLIPRETTTREAFLARQLSENWIAVSDTAEEDGESFLLTAGPARAEATLRLANSDTMHSGFIEALIGEARGDFWLYARRGGESMIRFGFQQSGRLYLQVWRQGELLTNQQRMWTQPADQVRLRLQIRGDAAYGFIDGEPAFGAPIRVPPNMGLGWWGISPWAPQFGIAQVVIREISGGPLTVTAAAFETRTNPWEDDELVGAIKDYSATLQAFMPRWYFQALDGRVTPEYSGPYSDVRLMARFHQIRLLPMVRGASPVTVDFDDLIALAEEEGVDGFTLVFIRMPDEEWFAEAEEKLVGSGLAVLAVRISDQNYMEVREMGDRVALFAGSRRIQKVPLVHPRTVDPAEPDGPASTALPDLIEEIPTPHRVLYFGSTEEAAPP